MDEKDPIEAGQTKSAAVLHANELMKQAVDTLRALKYSDYLKTDHWYDIRDAALYRNRHCHLCGADSQLHVHHRTYEFRGRERPEDLVVLCGLCHGAVHGRLPNTPKPGEQTERDTIEGIARNWHRRRF